MSDQLVTIDTKDVMDASVVETLRKVATMGKQQYQTFVEERLHPNSSKCLSDTIPKNKIRLFGPYPTKKLNKHKEQVFNLKADNQLFSRMYISCQVRQGNLAEFFRHENHAYSPALSVAGKLRQTTKSDLTECLLSHTSSQPAKPQVTAMVFDGAALVHMLPPKGNKTFSDYAEEVFLPYIKTHHEAVSHVDVVWDVYHPDSLKASTRENGSR